MKDLLLDILDAELRELWAEGEEEGRLQGKKNSSRRLALRMFEAGFTDLKQISEIVELPLGEVMTIICE